MYWKKGKEEGRRKGGKEEIRRKGKERKEVHGEAEIGEWRVGGGEDRRGKERENWSLG